MKKSHKRKEKEKQKEKRISWAPKGILPVKLLIVIDFSKTLFYGNILSAKSI